MSTDQGATEADVRGEEAAWEEACRREEAIRDLLRLHPNVPLPLRTALLAGFALATEDPARAIPAMWARTSGMHRAHFHYVLTDMPGGHRFRPWIAA